MRPLTHATDKLLAPYAGPTRAGRHWLESCPAETVELTSFDGLKLRGTLYENPAAKAPAAPFYYGQGMSYFTDTEGYRRTVADFLAGHLKA